MAFLCQSTSPGNPIMGLKTITGISNTSPLKAAGSASQFPCWFLPHILSLPPLGGLTSKHLCICSLEEVSAGMLDPIESLNSYCIVMRWDVLLSLLQKDHQTVQEL